MAEAQQQIKKITAEQQAHFRQGIISILSLMVTFDKYPMLSAQGAEYV
jgi:hypothetical protein